LYEITQFLDLVVVSENMNRRPSMAQICNPCPPRPRLQRGRFKLAFITPVLKLFARNANRWRGFVVRAFSKEDIIQ